MTARKVYKQKDGVGLRETLLRCKEKCGRTYPKIVSSWEAELEQLMTYLGYPVAIRWLPYATNLWRGS